MRVFSNLAISLDGKIGTAGREHVSIGSDEDKRRMQLLRARADAVVVGASTFRAWPLPMIEPGRSRPMTNAVITSRGVHDVDARRWPHPGVRLRVFGPPGLPSHDALGAEVTTRPDPDVVWALEELEASGCQEILVEGGGQLMFALAERDLLDELFVTLCPCLIGGGSAPTLMDGVGFSESQRKRLRLVGLDQGEQELFLHYTLR